MAVAAVPSPLCPFGGCAEPVLALGGGPDDKETEARVAGEAAGGDIAGSNAKEGAPSDHCDTIDSPLSTAGDTCESETADSGGGGGGAAVDGYSSNDYSRSYNNYCHPGNIQAARQAHCMVSYPSRAVPKGNLHSYVCLPAIDVIFTCGSVCDLRGFPI